MLWLTLTAQIAFFIAIQVLFANGSLRFTTVPGDPELVGNARLLSGLLHKLSVVAFVSILLGFILWIASLACLIATRRGVFLTGTLAIPLSTLLATVGPNMGTFWHWWAG